MGNLFSSSENHSVPQITETTVATLAIVANVAINPTLATVATVATVAAEYTFKSETTKDTAEPSSELKQLALTAPDNQVPKMDNSFEMDQVDNNSEIKLVVVGESDAAKTCVIQTYMQNHYVTKKKSILPSATGPESKVNDIYVPAQPSRSDVYNETK